MRDKKSPAYRGAAALAMGVLLLGWSRPVAAFEIRIISVPRGGEVEARFHAKAPLEVARQVLWDVELFPAFMPNARWVHVLRQSAYAQTVEMGGGAGPFELKTVTERSLEPSAIRWHAAAGGPLEINDGFWAFKPAAGGVDITYEVHVAPRLPVPGGVVAYLQKRALPSMIEAVRNRIEKVAAKVREKNP